MERQAQRQAQRQRGAQGAQGGQGGQGGQRQRRSQAAARTVRAVRAAAAVPDGRGRRRRSAARCAWRSGRVKQRVLRLLRAPPEEACPERASRGAGAVMHAGLAAIRRARGLVDRRATLERPRVAVSWAPVLRGSADPAMAVVRSRGATSEARRLAPSHAAAARKGEQVQVVLRSRRARRGGSRYPRLAPRRGHLSRTAPAVRAARRCAKGCSPHRGRGGDHARQPRVA